MPILPLEEQRDVVQWLLAIVKNDSTFSFSVRGLSVHDYSISCVVLLHCVRISVLLSSIDSCKISLCVQHIGKVCNDHMTLAYFSGNCHVLMMTLVFILESKFFWHTFNYQANSTFIACVISTIYPFTLFQSSSIDNSFFHGL